MRIIDPSSKFKLPDSVRKVLLIQLGDIGDVVWTTPSIRAAKNAVPGGKVSVMVREGFGGLLEADPSVDRVFEAKHYPGNLFQQAVGQLSFLRNLRAERFDLAVDLRLGDRGAFMAFATGAPMRATLYYPENLPFWRNYLFTHGVEVGPPVHFFGAAEQSLRILRKLGIDTDDVTPSLWVADSVKGRVREILTREKVNGSKGWITVNPFSRWPHKEWDTHKWIEVINWLGRDYAIPVIIVGSREEQAKAEDIRRQCKSWTFNFAGLTTLAELAGLLGQSLLHIGVDSAAPHIAAATGTPTITIYGPSSWKEWAPVGKNHRVIVSNMDCVPCHLKGCEGSGRSRCLETLTVDQAKNVIREAMEELLPKIRPAEY